MTKTWEELAQAYMAATRRRWGRRRPRLFISFSNDPPLNGVRTYIQDGADEVTLCRGLPLNSNSEFLFKVSMESLRERHSMRLRLGAVSGNTWMNAYIWPAEEWSSWEELELRLAVAAPDPLPS